MVYDPNETWGQFFHSMVSLEPPRLVPVTGLPPEQRPENRRLGSIRYMVNWRAQNFNETWKPLSQSATFPTQETNQLQP